MARRSRRKTMVEGEGKRRPGCHGSPRSPRLKAPGCEKRSHLLRPETRGRTKAEWRREPDDRALRGRSHALPVWSARDSWAYSCEATSKRQEKHGLTYPFDRDPDGGRRLSGSERSDPRRGQGRDALRNQRDRRPG